MEAALRTAADVLSGQSLEQIEYEAVRGVEGVKEATLTVGDLTLNVAVIHGGKQALETVNQLLTSDKPYHLLK